MPSRGASSWSAALASTSVMAWSSSSVILTPAAPGRAAAMWRGVRAPRCGGTAGGGERPPRARAWAAGVPTAPL